MSRTFKLVMIVTVALFLVILAAGTTRASEEPQIVRVVLRDYQVETSRFVVTSARPVQFVIANVGTLAHQFLVQPMTRNDATAADHAPVIAAGTLRTVQTVLSPGVYRIECAVKDHVERGMFSAIASETAPQVVFAMPIQSWFPLLMFVLGCVYIISDSVGLRLTWNK